MRVLLCLFVAACWALPASAASDANDIAVQFAALQERLLEAQERFAARQVETRRLAQLDWARAPEASACEGLRMTLDISIDDRPRALEAARLIDEIMKRLMKASDLKVSALCPSAVGDSSDYNAVSLTQGRADPGRTDAEEAADRTKAPKAVVVHRGLILAAGSDDELAAVIGHELGHLILQHLRARLELASLGDGSSLTKGLGAPAPDIAKRRMSWWGEGYLVETEMEADRFGAMLMARAGYDPSEFAAVLAHAEPTALRVDVRGEDAIRRDFDLRNAAAAKFASEFPVARVARGAAVLPRLKTLLAGAR